MALSCRTIEKDLIAFSLKIIVLHLDKFISCGLCNSGLLTRTGELILESCQAVQLLLVLLYGLTTCRQDLSLNYD
jgi:hypothetical protein